MVKKKNRILSAVLLVSVLSGMLLFFTGASNSTPQSSYGRILHATGRIMTEVHYSPKKIDDKFSSEIFDLFIKALDPDKDIFLASDIKQLEKFRFQIDNEINGDSIAFFDAAVRLFIGRTNELNNKLSSISKEPFSFSVNEVFITNDDDKSFATSAQEQEKKWRQRLKFTTLQKYVELTEKYKNSKAGSAVAKTAADIESESRKHAETVTRKYFNRLLDSKSMDRYFSDFINTITNHFDPHSSFFMPVDKRAWDEDLSGKFYGIGAMIGENNGQIIISSVTTGGAAWKSGEVNNGDAILRIGEETGEMTDITGYDIPDAVKLIRGNKGTTVRLMLKKADGTVRTVAIPRQELKLEETFAKSCIIQKDDKKIGYIYLPKFYTNFDGADGASCSKDVANEIKKLQRDSIDGLVIDLRDNGGGSLYEVVQMVGLFIPYGPVVQVKGRGNAPQVLEDVDRNVLYNGPLEVMVNEFSASASEIFAAAIQDYKRGVVTGSSSTYGKGTVQRPLPVNAAYKDRSEELGTIHITLQKYYRVNGSTTQLQGVKPDIVVPGFYEYYEMMEKDNPSALAYDNLQQSTFQPWSKAGILQQVIKQYKESEATAAAFNEIRRNAKWLAEEAKKPVSLEVDQYRARQKDIREKSTATRNLLKLKDSLSVVPNTVDMIVSSTNSDALLRSNRFIGSVKTDRYIGEALTIIVMLCNAETRDFARTKAAN